ncbi:MAG: hypothetical protein EBS39_05210, partial [Gammaproteobacteria bacterium]|nr:hypothetical protein [Gammaproteobacteria bacterium]
YSGGKFTDWGAHHVDIAHWALKQDAKGKGPIEINGADAKHPVPFKDGYPTVDDCYNTSHDFSVPCRFPGGTELVITSRGDNGILFEGTKGRMFVNRQKITGTPIEEGWDKEKFGDDDLKALYKGKPFEGHKQNFYRCIREGGLPVSDVFSHIVAMNTCHLASIAARLGAGADLSATAGEASTLLQSRVARGVERAGLAADVVTVQSVAPGRLQLVLRDAPFDAVATLAGSLARWEGITVVGAEITRTRPGRVEATLLLRAP